jgi:chromosome segregation ATPase
MSNIKVNFIYKDKKTEFSFDKDQLIQNVISAFVSSINRKIDEFYFFHNGEKIMNSDNMKLSELNNELFLKDSTIKKMNGEIQILKSELSSIKTNNNSLKNNNIILNKKNNEMILSHDEMQNYISNMKLKENDNRKMIDEYSSKIRDLQNELTTVRLKQNNEDKLINHKLLKIDDLELKLKENENKIVDYKNKYNNINNELNETKSMVFNLNKEKEDLLREKKEYQKNTESIILKDREILILNQNKEKMELKNKEQERELALLKKMIQNLQNDNESLRERMNDYEEIKVELECLKKRGNNYSFIEINKSSLKENYDKLLEENKKLKELLAQTK